MLCFVVEIPYYDQLRRADPTGAATLRGVLDRAAGGGLTARTERKGRFTYRVPVEPERALAAALDRVLALKRSLAETEGADPICVVYDSAADDEGADAEAERLLTSLEARSGSEAPAWRSAVLVHRGALEALGTAAAVAGDGEFLLLQGSGARPQPTPSPPQVRRAARPVSRPNVTNRIVEAVFAAIQGDTPRRPILVVGPDGSGKALAVSDAARLIMGPEAAPELVVVHPLYNRKSAVHPFLNSMRPALLDEVSRYLHTWERRVWASKLALVRSLVGVGGGGEPDPDRVPRESGGAEEPSAGVGGVCPDRAVADLYSAYRLYLTSYVRRMEQRGVPALVVFEDLHVFHPDALQYCVSLARDLGASPAFAVVATCRSGHDAAEVFGAEVTSLPAHPVTLDEIRGAAEALYPGVRLPERIARRIREQTGGQPLAVHHTLRHLSRTRKIQRGEVGYTWVTGLPARIPASPLTAAWEEMESLPIESRRLLYLCALAGGVLGVPEILDLGRALGGQEGESEDALRTRLAGLADAGLIRGPDEPYLLHSKLKTRLGSILGSWATAAREALADFLVAEWKAGRTRRLVLVYSLLRSERPSEALDVLTQVVTQKLDELNVKGCNFFLDPAKLRVWDSPPGFDRERFDRLAHMGALRASLLQGAWQRAESAMDAITNLDLPDTSPREQAWRALEQARFRLVKGDGPAAAKAAKTAVIQYHEAGDEPSERRAETELGAALLAEGRLEEARDYFGFVTRSKASPAFARVRASALAAVTSYLLGNFSASVRTAEEAHRIASEAGRREWEAFVLFLRSRQRFDLGQLDEAMAGLEKLSCLARVYGMERASRVAAIWRARCLCHAGEAAQADRLWERAGDGEEAIFFRAEGLYLRGQIKPALGLLGPIVPPTRRQHMDPGERVSWESGFASVEDRCVALRRDGGTVTRLCRGFRAYLTALDGRPEAAMRELYHITREERVSELDPYLPLYSYWYAATLPEEGGEGTDHKLTILNRAMKHLQQRWSRIENARDRSQLMTANYWNARLLKEGRARRLL